MSATTYVRLEILRGFRNIRFFVFSLTFPLVLYLFIAAPNRDERFDGIAVPLYLLAGMVSWGTMTAVTGSGARIAVERALGWNRQLRLTPLRPRVYLATKVLVAYLTALTSIVLLDIAGLCLGVRMSPLRWAAMTALVLIGLVPFAALGVMIGHLVTPDSIGPAIGGVTSLFALLGGAWGPIGSSALRGVTELLPSYWLVQAGKVGVGAEAWPPKAWLVTAGWSVVTTRLAVWAYRRDTARV